MNTLSKTVTGQFFSSATEFHTLETHWRSLINSASKSQLTAAHYLLYQALRGKDWRKAFTPITNQRKLANGAFCGWGLWAALDAIHYQPTEVLLAPFGDKVTPAMLQAVRQLLPYSRKLFSYGPEGFAKGDFPCAAYLLPEATLAIAQKG